MDDVFMAAPSGDIWQGGTFGHFARHRRIALFRCRSLSRRVGYTALCAPMCEADHTGEE